MKMKHTVKLISGNTETYLFPTKRKSDKALKMPLRSIINFTPLGVFGLNL